jgi:hypothetical protein
MNPKIEIALILFLLALAAAPSLAIASLMLWPL